MCKSVSQLGQDLWALDMLNNKRDGVFIEIGASDGIYLSNTYFLEKEFNWKGLCIEPSTEYINLVKNRNCLTSDILPLMPDPVSSGTIDTAALPYKS